DHARQALLAAREIQAQFASRQKEIAALLATTGMTAGIGIGIDSGELSFGEFGRSHRDLTAIGTVVNTAARAQSAAKPGHILVTEAVHRRAEDELPGSLGVPYELKGFEHPIELYSA
ncbi:MAG TPA: adenylate/guanylate cyclase domain-containing protein, partial [Stellaceae bacterium]|nr:adenylate/guanylate cyclase domain-containing protein [Stellaceae bacterium]